MSKQQVHNTLDSALKNVRLTELLLLYLLMKYIELYRIEKPELNATQEGNLLSFTGIRKWLLSLEELLQRQKASEMCDV